MLDIKTYRRCLLCLDLALQFDLLAVVQRSMSIADIRQQLENQLTKQLDILENSTNKEKTVS